jgi:uncharacterized membrane protein SirB2
MDVALIIKIHAILALVSIVVYIIRGGLMLTNSAAVNSKPLLAGASASMLLLLVTGIVAVVMAGLPFTDGFVILKIIGLVIYVVLGIAALKPGMAKGASIILWLLGLAAFAYTFLMAKGMVPVLF